MKRLYTILIAAAWTAGSARADAYKPTDDAEPVETLTTNPRGAARGELQQLQAAVRANAGDADAAARLARAYMDIGRTTGDPRYGGLAEATLAPWWTQA